jgi:two-component SAPR family response regulator
MHIPDRLFPPSADIDTDGAVRITVLGSVSVDGVEPISRRRTIEVIAYLALHRRGVTADQLKTAIWPDKAPAQSTFNVTVHRARAALGVDPQGHHHLPHSAAADGKYTVASSVTTDLELFLALAREARDADEPPTEIDLLHRALEMVGGPPFDGVTGYEWAFTEGIVIDAESAIADAAHRLAWMSLQRGDPTEANWAASRGLLAVPGSEPLVRDRMQAAHIHGDPAAVDRIVEELIRYIETTDPFDDLHPDTIALWQRYGRPRQRDAESS